MNVIGECGCNWTSLEEAKLMIKRSKEVGCWASKFQLFTYREAPNLPAYLYLNELEAKELIDYGKKIKQIVFFTPMYEEAVDFLEEVDIDYYKIRYKDRYNLNLVKKILDTKKPIFISYDYNDFYYGTPHRTHHREMEMPLLCVPKYPAKFKDYKLITFGYSDHTPTLKLLKYAKFHRALYFEKHVCLTKECLESEWSVTFDELKKVIK